jgi:hypothetical protein
MKGTVWSRVITPVRSPSFIRSSRRRFSVLARDEIREVLSTGEDLSVVALELRKAGPELVVITARPYFLHTRDEFVGISGLPEQFKIRRDRGGWCCSDGKRCWSDTPP